VNKPSKIAGCHRVQQMFTVPIRIIYIYNYYRSPFDTSVIISYHQFNSDILPKTSKVLKFCWKGVVSLFPAEATTFGGCRFKARDPKKSWTLICSRSRLQMIYSFVFLGWFCYYMLLHVISYYCIVFFLFVYLGASPGSNAGLVGRFGDNIRLWHGCRSSEGSEYINKWSPQLVWPMRFRTHHFALWLWALFLSHPFARWFLETTVLQRQNWAEFPNFASNMFSVIHGWYMADTLTIPAVTMLICGARLNSGCLGTSTYGSYGTSADTEAAAGDGFTRLRRHRLSGRKSMIECPIIIVVFEEIHIWNINDYTYISYYEILMIIIINDKRIFQRCYRIGT
jgi:hypothetical protein